jgi:hypothetical protein
LIGGLLEELREVLVGEVLGYVLGFVLRSARISETCSETCEEALGDVPIIDPRATRNSEKSLSVKCSDTCSDSCEEVLGDVPKSARTTGMRSSVKCEEVLGEVLWDVLLGRPGTTILRVPSRNSEKCSETQVLGDSSARRRDATYCGQACEKKVDRQQEVLAACREKSEKHQVN